MQGILAEITLVGLFCRYYYLNIEILYYQGKALSWDNNLNNSGVDIENAHQDFIETL